MSLSHWSMSDMNSGSAKAGTPPTSDINHFVKAWKGITMESHNERAVPVRVLSVDDNTMNQVVMESALVPLGHELQTCMDSGTELYEMLADMDRLPDIILLDGMLPSGSGVDVVKELRKTFSSSELPIILVSGKSSKQSIVEGLEAGANDYIVKPFDIAELVSRINTQLNVSAMVSARVEEARRTELMRKLPREITPRILAGETLTHQFMSHTSFLVVEIVGFSELSQQAQPDELLEILSALYSDFDLLCDEYNVFKVETGPDTYIVASGHTCEAEANKKHTNTLVELGLEMIRRAHQLTNVVTGGLLEVQVGLNSGPTSAGVINTTQPRYCFLGNTIEVAKNMQRHGFASAITVSAEAKALISASVECASLGLRVIPGSGPVETFVVKDKDSRWEEAVEAVRLAPNFVGYARSSPASSLCGSETKNCDSDTEHPTSCASATSEASDCRSGTQDSGEVTDTTDTECSEGHRVNFRVRAPKAKKTQGRDVVRQLEELNAEARQGVRQPGLRFLPAQARRPSRIEEARPCSRIEDEHEALVEVLTRSGLLHLLDDLLDQCVDVGTLANSRLVDLGGLGIDKPGDRLRVQRFARAYETLYGS